ncbi:MAG: hypothetical protein ACRC68_01235, partial [Clostridium sp.]
GKEYNKSITKVIPKENEENNKSITKAIPKENEEYNKGITKAIPKENEEYNKGITKVIPDTKAINILSHIDIKSIKEVIELIEPIKEVIQKYNQSITNENRIEIDSNLNNEIIPVGFKLDKELYNSWKDFTNKYKSIKNQDLLAMALIEYMKKYNKN